MSSSLTAYPLTPGCPICLEINIRCPVCVTVMPCYRQAIIWEMKEISDHDRKYDQAFGEADDLKQELHFLSMEIETNKDNRLFLSNHSRRHRYHQENKLRPRDEDALRLAERVGTVTRQFNKVNAFIFTYRQKRAEMVDGLIERLTNMYRMHQEDFYYYPSSNILTWRSVEAQENPSVVYLV